MIIEILVLIIVILVVVIYSLSKEKKYWQKSYFWLVELEKKPLTLTLMNKAFTIHKRFFGGIPKEYLMSDEDFEIYKSILGGIRNGHRNEKLNYKQIEVKRCQKLKTD